jgi:hypothetical protein
MRADLRNFINKIHGSQFPIHHTWRDVAPEKVRQAVSDNLLQDVEPHVPQLVGEDRGEQLSSGVVQAVEPPVAPRARVVADPSQRSLCCWQALVGVLALIMVMVCWFIDLEIIFQRILVTMGSCEVFVGYEVMIGAGVGYCHVRSRHGDTSRAKK